MKYKLDSVCYDKMGERKDMMDMFTKYLLTKPLYYIFTDQEIAQLYYDEIHRGCTGYHPHYTEPDDWQYMGNGNYKRRKHEGVE